MTTAPDLADASDPGAAPDPDRSAAGPGDGRPARVGRRRAVRQGRGEPDPPVDLRSVDDSDVGWQDPSGGSDDDRLRREVPPHW